MSFGYPYYFNLMYLIRFVDWKYLINFASHTLISISSRPFTVMLIIITINVKYFIQVKYFIFHQHVNVYVNYNYFILNY